MTQNLKSEMFRTILVATDRYRGGVPARRDVIALARKLNASLKVSYVVDFEELKIAAPSPPWGVIVPRTIRGGRRESRLVAEGRQRDEEFVAACDQASIPCDSDVIVGTSEMVWASLARACDLVLITPVEADFGRIDRWFGSMFWRIVIRATRPVLLLRPEGLSASGMVLFYSNRKHAARALPWVAGLCKGLAIPLTVHTSHRVAIEISRPDDECREFLRSHGVAAKFEGADALQVIEAEADRSDTELAGQSLLVLDRGFYSPIFWGKRRRLVERLIRTSHHSILLCP